MTNFEQIVNSGLLYVNGMTASRNVTVPNTQLDIAPGMCRDSTNTFDIVVGNYLGVNPNIPNDTVTTINILANGVNGLDTGTVAASTMYNIFAISDVSNFNNPACIMSTAEVPVLPFGYGAYRKIGYWMTDSSSHLLSGYVYGQNSERKFLYDAIQATTITAGNATAYTAVSLSGLVPSVDKIGVVLSIAITPNAAGNALFIRKTGGVGDQYVMKGQVAAVQLIEESILMAGLNVGVSSIDYKVTANTDAAVISVMGFNYSL